MKEIIFIIYDYGIDGKGRQNIIYASTNEEERDKWFDKNIDLNKSCYKKTEIIKDLDLVANETWRKLDALEKLSLERVNCILWKQKPMSKYSI